MAEQVFQATITHRPGMATLIMAGEINAFAEADLNAAYAQAEQDNPATILLDFSAVKYINSTGIALIVGLLARARRDRRRLVAFGLSPHYTELFQITHLSDFMTITTDLEGMGLDLASRG